MYIIVYSVTLTVGNVEVNAVFYHSLSTPVNDRFKLCLLGKRFNIKYRDKGTCSREKLSSFLCPRFKRQLRAINLKRLRKSSVGKDWRKLVIIFKIGKLLILP